MLVAQRAAVVPAAQARPHDEVVKSSLLQHPVHGGDCTCIATVVAELKAIEFQMLATCVKPAASVGFLIQDF